VSWLRRAGQDQRQPALARRRFKTSKSKETKTQKYRTRKQKSLAAGSRSMDTNLYQFRQKNGWTGRSSRKHWFSRSVGPALLALRAKMVSGRAGPAVEHRMACAARAAPESPSASFRNLDHRAIGNTYKSGRDRCTGGGCYAKDQRGAQKECPNHPVPLPAWIKSNRFTDRAGKSLATVTFSEWKSIETYPDNRAIG
jgi:hypothetical protein